MSRFALIRCKARYDQMKKRIVKTFNNSVMLYLTNQENGVIICSRIGRISGKVGVSEIVSVYHKIVSLFTYSCRVRRYNYGDKEIKRQA